MGNQIMGKFRKNRYRGFQADQMDYVTDKWTLISTDGYIDLAKFQKAYLITKPEAQAFLNFMDIDKQGKVDFYKFTLAAAALCQQPTEVYLS